jgi:hypothetical protein
MCNEVGRSGVLLRRLPSHAGTTVERWYLLRVGFSFGFFKTRGEVRGHFISQNLVIFLARRFNVPSSVNLYQPGTKTTCTR